MRQLFRNLLMPILRHVRLLVVLILFYLLQVCVMPYFRIGNVTPSVIWIMLSVVASAYHWYDGVMCGLIVAILMEIMCPTVPMLNLAGYSVITCLALPLFLPKSTRQLLQAKYSGKTSVNTHTYRKTLLCTTLTNLMWQIVNCAYVFLTNDHIPGEFISRGFFNVLFTTILATFLVPFIWLLLGVRRQKHGEKESEN